MINNEPVLSGFHATVSSYSTHMKTRIGTGIVIVFLSLVASLSAQTLTRGPYLQMGNDQSVVVRWRTSSSTNSVVRFGASADSLTKTKSQSGARMEHQVRLTGLSANTKYFYSIGATGKTLAQGSDYFFVTSPTPGTRKNTRIWVIGDAGTADSNQAAVRNAYENFTGSRHTDLWLMLGDNAYNDGTDSEYQAAVFNMYPAMLRKSVLWSTMGNHEGHTANSGTQSGPYYKIFTFPKNAESGGRPSGTEAYYSFDYANIHFVCLDSHGSNRSSTGPMLTWLKDDLANTSQEWIIAFFHHPPYSKGSHNSDTETQLKEMRQNALPILEDYGVDLVLCGHSHSYERSFLLDGHYGLSTTLTSAMIKDGGSGRVDSSGAYEKPTIHGGREGAVYAVAGSSGKISGGALNHPAMFVSLNVLGSMVLDVDGTRLDAQFIDNLGNRRDYFTITKGTPSTAVTKSFQVGVTPATNYGGAMDATIKGTSPTNFLGSAVTLEADGSPESNVLLRWGLANQIPTNSIVQSASMTFNVVNTSPNAYGVYRLKKWWKEGEVNWNQRYAGNQWELSGAKGATDRDSKVLASFTAAQTGSLTVPFNSDGIAAVQSWVKSNNSNLGVILSILSTGTDGVDVSSREATTATLRPKLTITYSLPE
jgi:acid phosphatase type 7